MVKQKVITKVLDKAFDFLWDEISGYFRKEENRKELMEKIERFFSDKQNKEKVKELTAKALRKFRDKTK